MDSRSLTKYPFSSIRERLPLRFFNIASLTATLSLMVFSEDCAAPSCVSNNVIFESCVLLLT